MRKFAISRGGTDAGILLAIFIVVASVAPACGYAAHELSKDSTADAQPTVQLGANFDVGGLSVSDMKASFRSDLGSDGFTDTTAKGVYVVVTAHVTNNGTKAHSLDSMYQKLLVGNKEYSADSFANIGTSGQMKTSVDPEPGFSDDVTFVFDVPRSSADTGTGSFTEKTVLDVSGGLDFDAPKPSEVKVSLGGG